MNEGKGKITKEEQALWTRDDGDGEDCHLSLAAPPSLLPLWSAFSNAVCVPPPPRMEFDDNSPACCGGTYRRRPLLPRRQLRASNATRARAVPLKRRNDGEANEASFKKTGATDRESLALQHPHALLPCTSTKCLTRTHLFFSVIFAALPLPQRRNVLWTLKEGSRVNRVLVNSRSFVAAFRPFPARTLLSVRLEMSPPSCRLLHACALLPFALRAHSRKTSCEVHRVQPPSSACARRLLRRSAS